MEHEVWDVLQRHLNSIYSGDAKAYEATTSADLSLYEWWVAPHRQDGLDFHRFMIEHRWAGDNFWEFDSENWERCRPWDYEDRINRKNRPHGSVGGVPLSRRDWTLAQRKPT